MKAVIMAGGEGSRLRPLTCDRPKPLVPVCNRPVMAYILDLLAEHGFQEVFVTLGYMPDTVSAHFGQRYRSMDLHYLVEEKPLGTAGGVAALRGRLDETFLVVSGDALTDVDLSCLIRFHRQADALATLAMTRVENPLEYGVIMTDRQGRIRRFLEKPGWGEVFSDMANTGIYVLEPRALDGVPRDRPYDFSQHLFPAMLQMDAPLFGVEAEGYWCDIGDPAAYLQANLDLLEGRLRFKPPGREAAPGVWVMGEMLEGVLVDGPALIGEGCRLAPGTHLEAGVVLGPATVTGAGAALRRTVTWSGVQVGTNATLVGTTICEGAALEAGVGVFAGAVIGPGCRIGERAMLAPGVRLWPRTVVTAGASVDCTLVQSPVWTGRLLRQGGMEGRLGEDLFPENALRVGTAYASVLAGVGPLVIGSDPGPEAMLIKQAILCGALAAGRNVLDVGVTASMVCEYAIVQWAGGGGIHVRAAGELNRVVFYDGMGRPARRDLQRKLEQACLRQDYRRAEPGETGAVEPFVQAERLYLEHLGAQVDLPTIRARRWQVDLGCEAWPLLGRWLNRLGCRFAEGGVQSDLRLELDPLEGTWRLRAAPPQAMLALEVWLGLRAAPTLTETVPVPVTASRAVEEMIRRTGRCPVRVRQTDWRPADPLLTLGRLLEWMSAEELTQRDLVAQLPCCWTVVRTVACPWEAKGRVMRRLLEEHAEGRIDLVDGIRIERPDGWALLMPDPDEPVYRVYTEADDAYGAEMLAEEYSRRVSALLVP